jgi:hypothetical protein
VNVVAPAVLWHSAEDHWSCPPGAWTGDPTPTFAYRWFERGTVVPGATEQTYAPLFVQSPPLV